MEERRYTENEVIRICVAYTEVQNVRNKIDKYYLDLKNPSDFYGRLYIRLQRAIIDFKDNVPVELQKKLVPNLEGLEKKIKEELFLPKLQKAFEGHKGRVHLGI